MTTDTASHKQHTTAAPVAVPKALPWVIVLLIAIYLGITVGVGRAFLAGSESPKILAAASWLPIPVARVDGQLVWARQYLQYRTFIQTFIERAQQNGQPIDTATPLNDQVIQLLVSNRTVERAAKTAGIRVSNEEIDAAYSEILVAQGGGGEAREVSEEELNTILHELYGSTQGQLRELIRVRLLENKVRQEVLEQVNFRQILVTDEAKANELLGKIQGGEAFDGLAKEFSQHSESRENGGNIGFVARGDQPSAEIEAAIFASPIGLIPQPVKSDFGYHIIEVLEKKGAVQQSFEDWLATARNDYRIRVYYHPVS